MAARSGLGAFYLPSHPGSGRQSAGGPLVALREGATVGLPFFSRGEHHTYREDSDSCRQDSVREKAWPQRKEVSFSLVTAQGRPAVPLHSHTGIQIPALLSLYPPQGQGVVSRCGSQTSSISSRPPPPKLGGNANSQASPIPTESESRAGAQLLVAIKALQVIQMCPKVGEPLLWRAVLVCALEARFQGHLWSHSQGQAWMWPFR